MHRMTVQMMMNVVREVEMSRTTRVLETEPNMTMVESKDRRCARVF